MQPSQKLFSGNLLFGTMQNVLSALREERLARRISLFPAESSAGLRLRPDCWKLEKLFYRHGTTIWMNFGLRSQLRCAMLLRSHEELDLRYDGQVELIQWLEYGHL